MQISINGEPKDITDGITVRELLEQLDIRPKLCAVERNKELVPRKHHDDCVLVAGDKLEIVTLVGGG